MHQCKTNLNTPSPIFPLPIPMKDMSFFLLKNSLGAKMRKGIRNFCNGDASTSTLNQRNNTNHPNSDVVIPSPDPYNYMHNAAAADSTTTTTAAVRHHSPSTATLEEMILRLELEEEIARKSMLDDDYYNANCRRRMSCVNNSDILRSARNALNQYPRFSLDGKDAMYRSSFRNSSSDSIAVALGNAGHRRRSVTERINMHKLHNTNNSGEGDGVDLVQSNKLHGSNVLCYPSTLGGENVIWCKPGVVAKLMGLEAIPVPLPTNVLHTNNNSCCRESRQTLSSIIKRQNLRRRAERHEMERRFPINMMRGNKESAAGNMNGKMKRSSGSRTGYCVMKSVDVDPPHPTTAAHACGWPTQRFR